ncbi:unnamed protein product [Bursaphelenchus xylophilus]|uniref:(pine wood nematode) hypothetical protein n=1 Tax=Bursaphelenchus xylophilus TaxID=6326 RepID=A0A1I7SME7_BURXY|nr:unnamed protein product [Bursaphelenchus xylophilus]CAG9130156.1 unnamed protein product [Bursaphelenchus xylophilus]
MSRKYLNCTSSKSLDSLEDELMANARPVRDINEDQKSVAWHDAIHLLPPIISNRLKQVENAAIKDFKISGRPSRQGQSKLYCMTLKWFENLPEGGNTEQMRQSTASKQSSCPSEISRMETCVELDNDVSVDNDHTVYPDGHRCEGPCGKMRPISELTLFGQCEHSICSSCIKELSPLFDDPNNPVCCNVSCISSHLVDTLETLKERRNAYQKLINEECYEKILEKYDPKGYKLYSNLAKGVTQKFKQPESNQSEEVKASCENFSSDINPTTFNSSIVNKTSESNRYKTPSDLESEEFVTLSILLLDGSDRRVETNYNAESTLKSCVDNLAASYCPNKKVRVFYEEGEIFKRGRAYFIDMDKYGHFPLSYLPSKQNIVSLIFDVTNLLQNVKNRYIQC